MTSPPGWLWLALGPALLLVGGGLVWASDWLAAPYGLLLLGLWIAMLASWLFSARTARMLSTAADDEW